MRRSRAAALFCDEWAQAVDGGELTGARRAGRVDRDEVTSSAPSSPAARRAGAPTDEITLFDSTGLAIQDLAIAIAVYEAWREGRIDASLARL